MLQIEQSIPPVDLFTEYVYFSSFSETMLQHADESAAQHIRRFGLDARSQVIEIASNDGYLLRHFQKAGIPCLGIEPAANVAAAARAIGIESWTRFFGTDLAREIREQGREADLILANNVFAHVPTLHDFVEGLRVALKPSGCAVLEFPYAMDMLQRSEFDTIYHEHVFYFALTPLVPLFGKHDLKVARVERLPIHGGSLRLYVRPRSGSSSIDDESVERLLKEETDQGISSSALYEAFRASAEKVRAELNDRLRQGVAEGKRIAAYGASAKGSTLLNFCGLGKPIIEFVVDRSPHKQGKLTPGQHLPILPPEELIARRPDWTLLLTWNFADEILQQQAAYRNQGGHFLIPIPRLRLV